ncbi:hypothetical protein [Kineosporia sp. A_224]|uniref:hypothetical protein n=1 Tax=Kineosporia sp. A_224 TaxID=1962180 RepID=UPI000B4B1AF9|nr:hypothetical protein [Kineosporia sp. A_224]
MSTPAGAGRAHDDALHLLAPGGCPVCAATHDGVESWARAFVNEARADLEAMDGVRDALGFCPVHTRRMLADPAASWVLPAVAAEVVAEGRERLGGGLAGRRPAGVAVCPACVRAARSADGAAGRLVTAMADARVREAFEAGGGVCAPHLVDLAGDAAAGRDGAAVRDLAARLVVDRLDGAPAQDRLLAVTGDDPDAGRRAALFPALERLAAQDDEAAAEGGGAALARLWLARPTCPLCTAAAVTGWRYVAWLVGAAAAPGRGDAPSRQDVVLCEVHLTDAAQVGGPRLDEVVGEAAAAARARVGRALAAPGRRGRAGRRDDPASGLGCRACAAADTALDRAWDLLDAVAADGPLTTAARAGHGVCLRHGLRTAAGHGTAGRLFGEVLDGRLAVLAWDVREGLRLGRWDTRFAPAGASATAWRRATTLLDGRIDLGTPVT